MRLVLWPAVVTFAITLLRLFGELQGWSRFLFNPDTGGGGAPVGIAWLPLVFGPYFAWLLAKRGDLPQSAWKVAGLGLLGTVIAIAVFVSVQVLGLIPWGVLVALLVALALAFLPWKAWPQLARTLFLYALAARLPVVIVMLFAIYGNWGTHYDVLPPDPTPQLIAAGPLERWFWIGLVPQGTIWIAHTVLVGSVFGGLFVALAKPRPAPPGA